MQCLHPIYAPNKKFGQTASLYQHRYNLVPCGKCLACKAKAQKDWIFRLKYEERSAKQSLFVTYTYDDEHLYLSEQGVPSVNKRDFQLYLKRLRKRLPSESLRYFCVSEYGSKTHRPHYHAIMFNYSDIDLREIVHLDWPCGHIDIGTVTDASIAYTLKYCLKGSTVPEGAEDTFRLSSRNPAIGLGYVQDARNVEYIRQHGFLRDIGGRIQRVPKYYKDKLPFDLLNEEQSLVDSTLDTYGSYMEFAQRVQGYENNRLKRLTDNEIL